MIEQEPTGGAAMKMVKQFGIMAVVALLVNMALLAGMVWVVVWVLRALHVID
jgi:hypothetical protein